MTETQFFIKDPWQGGKIVEIKISLPTRRCWVQGEDGFDHNIQWRDVIKNRAIYLQETDGLNEETAYFQADKEFYDRISVRKRISR